MEPICPICKGKTKDNTYLWNGEKLYHKICFKVAGMKLPEPKVEKAKPSPKGGQSVTVDVNKVGMGAKGKSLVN